MPIRPTPFGEAVQRAIDKVNENDVSTRWANAALPEPGRPAPTAAASTPTPSRSAT